MMPLALIGAFALTGWGLFAFMVYRAGKSRSLVNDTVAENVKLLKMLKNERIACELQIRKMGEVHHVDADSINDTLKRMRNREAGK